MRYLFSTLLSLAIVTTLQKLHAQISVPNSVLPKVYQNTFNTPAKVGDDVSELYLGKIINHPTIKEAYVNTFKGKLLILDFWNTFCSICIKSFPKFDSLQTIFKDKVVILPVGFDGLKEGSIEAWVKKRIGTDYGLRNLPTAIQAPEDTTLFKMFPTQGFPYEIWIDSNGTVIGMTDHRLVNANNIRKLLNGEVVELMPKRVVKHSISGGESSMDNIAIIRPNKLDIGSRLTAFIDTITGGFPYTIQYDSAYARLCYLNLSIVDLYKKAFNVIDSNITLDDMDEKKVIIVENGRPFYKRKRDYIGKGSNEYYEFRQNGLFCYDLILPKSFNEIEAANIMIQDLDRFFRIKSSIEKRIIKCLVLIRTSNNEKFKAKSEYRVPDLTFDPLDVKIRSTPFSSFVGTINRWFSPLILDNTNYQGKIDLDLEMDKRCTLQELRSILKKYDLDLIEADREVHFLKLENK